jgi:hypothetical protein
MVRRRRDASSELTDEMEAIIIFCNRQFANRLTAKFVNPSTASKLPSRPSRPMGSPRSAFTFYHTRLRLSGLRYFCGTACRRNATNTGVKAYSNSLLLPKTAFPLRADAVKREHLFRKRTCEDLYEWQVGRPPVVQTITAEIISQNISELVEAVRQATFCSP